MTTTKYRNPTTATDLQKKEKPQTDTPAQRREKWHRMTPEQIIKETPIEDLKRFAKRGAPMAIVELKRRTIPEHEAEAMHRYGRGNARRNDPGIFRTQAEILSERHASRIPADPELNLGV